MKKVLVLFVCVFVTCISVQAQTYFFTGNYLVELMRGYDKFIQGNAAIEDYIPGSTFVGYVIGVCDAMQVHIPGAANLNHGQMAAVVAKYLKEHPELWAEPAHILVRQAIIEAFKLKR